MKTSETLLAQLPAVRGRYVPDYPLAKVTWFRVGGCADISYKPEDVDDLIQFFKGKPAAVPVSVIGVGSNLLVRDGGLAGVVIRLGKAFAEVTLDGEDIEVGAGALDSTVAMVAAQKGLAGLEFLSGIPGSIGGALRMNAGCYGREMKDVLLWVEAVDGQGHHHHVAAEDLDLSYRHCGAPQDWIFTRARLKGQQSDVATVTQAMEDIKAQREESQPLKTRTGGSTFANPSGPHGETLSAWKLIDEAGCRGLQQGQAQVSEKHCNFLLNLGGATAEEIENLGEEVRRRVFAHSGIELRWEIQRIGKALQRADVAGAEG